MAKKAVDKAKKHARSTSGHYKADDPSTPDVNEAFVSVGGVAASTNKKSKKSAVIPLVTLTGDRMYPEQAKKYWAKINKGAS